MNYDTLLSLNIIVMVVALIAIFFASCVIAIAILFGAHAIAHLGMFGGLGYIIYALIRGPINRLADIGIAVVVVGLRSRCTCLRDTLALVSIPISDAAPVERLRRRVIVGGFRRCWARYPVAWRCLVIPCKLLYLMARLYFALGKSGTRRPRPRLSPWCQPPDV